MGHTLTGAGSALLVSIPGSGQPRDTSRIACGVGRRRYAARLVEAVRVYVPNHCWRIMVGVRLSMACETAGTVPCWYSPGFRGYSFPFLALELRIELAGRRPTSRPGRQGQGLRTDVAGKLWLWVGSECRRRTAPDASGRIRGGLPQGLLRRKTRGIPAFLPTERAAVLTGGRAGESNPADIM